MTTTRLATTAGPVDYITSLPVEILNHIVGFVESRPDAVKVEISSTTPSTFDTIGGGISGLGLASKMFLEICWEQYHRVNTFAFKLPCPSTLSFGHNIERLAARMRVYFGVDFMNVGHLEISHLTFAVSRGHGRNYSVSGARWRRKIRQHIAPNLPASSSIAVKLFAQVTNVEYSITDVVADAGGGGSVVVNEETKIHNQLLSVMNGTVVHYRDQSSLLQFL